MNTARRASRVRFDDEVTNLPAVYAPSQRWSVRTSRIPINGLPVYTDPRDRRGSDATLVDDREDHAQNHFDAGHQQPLRSALRRSISVGVVDDPVIWSRPGFRKRSNSCLSTGSGLFDADDPRVTGLEEKKNRERAAKATQKAFDVGHKFNKSKVIGEVVHSRTGVLSIYLRQSHLLIPYAYEDIVQRQDFILRLAKALMSFGAPSHRIEAQLVSVSHTLEIDAEFVYMPSIIISSFGDYEKKTSETHFVKAGGRLSLGKLHNVHDVYRSVVRGHMDAEEGCMHLSQLLRSPPLYGIPLRCLFAFLCCASICPMAFGGSLADGFISGLGGALLCYLQLVVAHKNAMYADVFE